MTQNGGQRRPQFVAHVGQELRLVTAGDLELAARFLKLREEPRVLKCQGRLTREGLEQLDQPGRELTRCGARDHQTTQDTPFQQQRHGQE